MHGLNTGRWLAVALLVLGVARPALAQDAKQGGEVPSKPLEIQGEVSASSHTVKLEKGVTYRLTAKAENFNPSVSVRSNLSTIAGISGGTREVSLIFTASDTREYQIVVHFAPYGVVPKGDQKYVFLLERATFTTEHQRQEKYQPRELTRSFEAGKFYALTVSSTDFAPLVCIADGERPIAYANHRVGAFVRTPAGKPLAMTTTVTFTPNRTGEHRILVERESFGPFDVAKRRYTATIIEVKPDLTFRDALTAADPIHPTRQAPHKVHVAKLTAGKTYQIDLRSDTFDPYLLLEEADGKSLSQYFGGTSRHAKIVYRPKTSSDFRLVATALNRGRSGNYTLTVIENANAQVVSSFVAAPLPTMPAAIARRPEPAAKVVELKPLPLKADTSGAAAYEGRLTDEDARYNGTKLCKTFTLPLEAGKAYRIDVASRQFDAYLYLQDPGGRVVGQNDDNGESSDARLLHTPDKGGDYQIVATSMNGTSTGGFRLKVQPASEGEVRFAALDKQIANFLVTTPEQRGQTVDELRAYLAKKGREIDRADLGLAFRATHLLQLAKEDKAAAEASRQLAALIARSDHPETARGARKLEGVSRRLNLVGDVMELKGKTLDGKQVDLATLKGKVVLVDFWATWFRPSVVELPQFKELYRQYPREDFELISISIDEQPEKVREFAAKMELPWPCMCNGSSKESLGLAEQYGVTFLPQAIVVGRDGRVVSVHARGSELAQLVEKLISKR